MLLFAVLLSQKRQLFSNSNKTTVTSQFHNNTCVESDKSEDEDEDDELLAVQTIESFVTSEAEDSHEDKEVDLQSLDEEITSIVTKLHDNERSGGKHTTIQYICNIYYNYNCI